MANATDSHELARSMILGDQALSDGSRASAGQRSDYRAAIDAQERAIDMILSRRAGSQAEFEGMSLTIPSPDEARIEKADGHERARYMILGR